MNKLEKIEGAMGTSIWRVVALSSGLSLALSGCALYWRERPSLALGAFGGAVLVTAFTLSYLWRLEQKASRQLSRALRSSKFASLGEMAAGMAHEINTPLGAITLSVSQLKDLVPAGCAHEAVIHEIIEDVLSSSERIARLVRGMKNFSRDTGLGTDFVFFNLSTVIQESLAICEASLKKSEVALRTGKFPDRLDLQGNPSQVSQVIVNLVNNARDAVEGTDSPWVAVSVRVAKDKVEIRVTDSGKGLPEHVREKLFQPFFTTKEVGKGTGIGLNIVQGIVEAHHGLVYLDESSPQTSFVVSLPRLQGS